MRFLPTPIALILVLLWVVPVNAGPDERHDIKHTIKKTFDVEPGGTLELDVDRGNVWVKTGSSSVVRFEIERTIAVDNEKDAKRIFDQHKVDFAHKSDGVRMESKFEKGGWNWKHWRNKDQFRVKVTVTVPEEYDVEVVVGAGNVGIASLEGDIEISSGAGNVDVDHIEGDVEVVTGTGNVGIKSIDGTVEVVTGAGNVDLGNVAGELNATTGAGNVTARISRQPSDDSQITTGAGNVTAYLADDIGVDVNAVARVGSCSTDYPLKISGKWMKKSFSGSLNGGGPSLSLEAGVGNVTLKRF